MEDEKNIDKRDSKETIKKENNNTKDEGLRIQSDQETYGDGFPQEDASPSNVNSNQKDISRPFDSGVHVPAESSQLDK